MCFHWELLRQAAQTSLEEKERYMNRDTIAGHYRQLKGRIRENWGKLTGNDGSIVAGRRDQLLGQVQVCCGIKPEEAERELKHWGILQ
jgi:uncharacterized protein YjbJ (UPF0337 family)